MMNITVDDRRRPLTGIEKLQLIQRINRENDPQRRVDAIVLATQICMKESLQAKVDDIVAKTKFALEICKRESQQAKVDGYVKEAISSEKKSLTGIERLQLLEKVKVENGGQMLSVESFTPWVEFFGRNF